MVSFVSVFKWNKGVPFSHTHTHPHLHGTVAFHSQNEEWQDKLKYFLAHHPAVFQLDDGGTVRLVDDKAWGQRVRLGIAVYLAAFLSKCSQNDCTLVFPLS